MPVPFQVQKACDTASLNPCPINPDWIREGQPVAQAAPLFASEDGLCTGVIWACSPGKFEWFYDRDETLYVISGKFILDEGKPTERTVVGGDNVFFPAGSQAHWNVIEPVLKIATVRKNMPGIMKSALAAYRFVRNRGKQPAGMFGELDAVPARP